MYQSATLWVDENQPFEMSVMPYNDTAEKSDEVVIEVRQNHNGLFLIATRDEIAEVLANVYTGAVWECFHFDRHRVWFDFPTARNFRFQLENV